MMRTNYFSGGPYEDEYGYCRAVRIGDTIHVSGSTDRPPNVSERDTYQQAVAAIATAQAALVEAGAGLEAVVRTVTYVTDISDVCADG